MWAGLFALKALKIKQENIAKPFMAGNTLTHFKKSHVPWIIHKYNVIHKYHPSCLESCFAIWLKVCSKIICMWKLLFEFISLSYLFMSNTKYICEWLRLQDSMGFKKRRLSDMKLAEQKATLNEISSITGHCECLLYPFIYNIVLIVCGLLGFFFFAV